MCSPVIKIGAVFFRFRVTFTDLFNPLFPGCMWIYEYITLSQINIDPAN